MRITKFFFFEHGFLEIELTFLFVEMVNRIYVESTLHGSIKMECTFGTQK